MVMFIPMTAVQPSAKKKKYTFVSKIIGNHLADVKNVIKIARNVKDQKIQIAKNVKKVMSKIMIKNAIKVYAVMVSKQLMKIVMMLIK